ncbi:DUF4231 domain-containing protein [Streptomyces albidoflavus]|uniref:DUF4231 domain-containing protein n=1 Tax=Streptomyces albidoflavus TaxID=1886 RepID=UPI0010207497|nr:SLATT domain-containing protein [Streptomyces albidoflavus]
MTQPEADLSDPATELIIHRRSIAKLKASINRVRMVTAMAVIALALSFIILLSLIIITAQTWGEIDMSDLNLAGLILTAFLVTGAVFLLKEEAAAEGLPNANDEGKSRKSLNELWFDLEIAEEQRLRAAISANRPAHERRYVYRDAIPAEVSRLRAEGLRYRRWHNGLQWLLILCSAAIPAVSALYDPPQPGKGILIGLGAAVSVITSVMGYFKFRERSFNLHQTADSIARHISALDLSIPPYNHQTDEQNLGLFAETVEALRDEQRKREQQLDQPHQGQQGQQGAI